MGILKELKEKQEMLNTVQKEGERDIDLSAMGQLKLEISTLQEKIEKNLLKLGEKVYESYRDKGNCGFSEEIRNIFLKLENLRDLLKQKESRMEKLTVLYEAKVIDSERMMELKEDLDRAEATIEQYVITDQSPFQGKLIRDLPIPRDVLIGAILRGKEVVIPDGDTLIQINDKLTLIGRKSAVVETLKVMTPNL